MDNLQVFKVYPSIPEPLMFLDYLSKNLWWCWNYDAVELFRRINPVQWEAKKRNPVAFLTSISQRRFEELTEDEGFMGHMERVKARFEAMFSFAPGFDNLQLGPRDTIAYFSMEFGLHESLPLFAGGLGMLAGDHLKAASSLGIPLTGVGLLFREGYFSQVFDLEGWQQEAYPEIDIFDLPVQRARDTAGDKIFVRVESPHGTILAKVWQVKVGRLRLLLLDTNIRENSPFVRDITGRLYSSNLEIRIAQEALLGIGGMRVLERLDIFPAVIHMNEGHCAFAGLERIVQVMNKFSVDMGAAWEICKRSSVFTTHTPVAAGHDEFPPALVKPYLEPFAEQFDMTVDELLLWGRMTSADKEDPFFYMCVLGMNLAGYLNGVSRLHGSVAREMWTGIWPERPVEEVPISHITNGVHILSYISQQKAALFERYLATDWGNLHYGPDLVQRIDNIDDDDLWHVHGIDRSRLIRYCRKILLDKYSARSAPRHVLDTVSSVLDNNVLTICFARRFATYKRADLLLKDPDRLEALINSETRPIQLIFAGKAHPSDNQGKQIIQRIMNFARRDEVRHRVVFLEDYDINIARYMVQGADVWLNTPRRPNEACGTSGMKAAVNGSLNLSILDGWWCEGYSPDRGWAIGDSCVFQDGAYQDSVESQAFYNILENDVIPCFYDRKPGNSPGRWVEMMKGSMKMALLDFSSNRMVKEYTDRFYVPASINMGRLTADRAGEATVLATAKKRLSALWKDVRVEKPSIVSGNGFRAGDTFRLKVKVSLGELEPDEVEVQIYYGRLRSLSRLKGGRVQPMELQERTADNACVYGCSLTCFDAGRFGYTARVIPHGDEILKASPGLMTWAE
ncbi:MAG: glycosyltransferase family 1 protein [Desulfobacteraceae bacterium]|nr:glycosyltransferase family 1 protein [Desulfobacteraceae bacterium]